MFVENIVVKDMVMTWPKAVASFPGLCSTPIQGAAGGRGGVAPK